MPKNKNSLAYTGSIKGGGSLGSWNIEGVFSLTSGAHGEKTSIFSAPSGPNEPKFASNWSLA